ncbi:hypothetical protein EV360DRAFT_76203 [Lentinula raphanica]|nr:hypothetical protein EV360DRAFT_76203 [Lentinula raphanica]
MTDASISHLRHPIPRFTPGRRTRPFVRKSGLLLEHGDEEQQGRLAVQADVTHLYMVNRRGLGFFNSLNLDRIGLIDISHSDFANFRISFQQLAAKIAEFDPKLPNRPSLQRQHTLSTAPGSYKRLVKGVHDVLSSGAQHVIVLITTHCDKHGQLAWAGIPELTVNKFLAQAFPDDLALKFSSISAHLILLCCSGIFRNQEAYDSLVQFAQRVSMLRGIFQSIIAFPNEHQLQPYLTATFLLHWFQRIVRHQESYERALPGICLSVPEIGHHTHIFCAFKQPLGPVRFLKAIWCHRYRAPFGIQWQQSICKDCHCFNSLVFKRNRSLKQLQIQCKNSKHKQCKNRWLPIDGIFLDTPEGFHEPTLFLDTSVRPYLNAQIITESRFSIILGTFHFSIQNAGLVDEPPLFIFRENGTSANLHRHSTASINILMSDHDELLSVVQTHDQKFLSSFDGDFDENDDDFTAASSSTSNANVIVFSDKTAAHNQKWDATTKLQGKAFMSSKISKMRDNTLPHTKNPTLEETEEDLKERSNIKNDVLLHKLVHTQLLSGSLNPELELTPAQRRKALSGRIVELTGDAKLGRRAATTKRVREGLVQKQKEGKAAQLEETKNLGNYHPTLKRLLDPDYETAKPKKRIQGLQMGVGSFKDGTLRLSRREIDSVQAHKGGTSGRGSRRGGWKKRPRKRQLHSSVYTSCILRYMENLCVHDR